MALPSASRPAHENFLNSIMLHVRVPVLSEKTYSTWPSSSLSLEFRTIAAVLLAAWYIWASFPIK